MLLITITYCCTINEQEQGQIQGVPREQVHPLSQLIPQYISKPFLTPAFAEFNTFTYNTVTYLVQGRIQGGPVLPTLPQLPLLAAKDQNTLIKQSLIIKQYRIFSYVYAPL